MTETDIPKRLRQLAEAIDGSFCDDTPADEQLMYEAADEIELYLAMQDGFEIRIERLEQSLLDCGEHSRSCTDKYLNTLEKKNKEIKRLKSELAFLKEEEPDEQ